MIGWDILLEVGSQELAAWIFGTVAFVFLMLLILLPLRNLPAWKVNILAIITALLAGVFCTFLTGSIILEVKPDFAGWGKTAIQAGGGVALFVFVLLWWQLVLKPQPTEKRQMKVVITKRRIKIIITTLGVFGLLAILTLRMMPETSEPGTFEQYFIRHTPVFYLLPLLVVVGCLRCSDYRDSRGSKEDKDKKGKKEK